MTARNITNKTAHARRFRRRGLRALAIALSLMFFLIAAGCSSSEMAGGATKPTYSKTVSPENKRYLRQDEWVRMLTLVLNFPEDRPTLWASIPETQRQDISYSDFLAYVEDMENGIRANITSFSEIAGDEKETLLRRLARTGIALEPKPEQCSYWWLNGQTEDGRALRFAVAVAVDEDGIPYFSATWLDGMRATYNYIALYLDAIHRQSPQALAALIQQHVPLRSTAHLEAIRNRTDALLDYYQKNIALGTDMVRVRTLMPGFAVIEEPLAQPSASGTSNTYTVRFLTADGVFRAEETIATPLAEQDARVYFGDTLLFDLNEEAPRVNDEALLEVLGVPLLLEPFEDDNGVLTRFRVAWPGLFVEASGSCDPNALTFDGVIQHVQCAYSMYRTGSDLKAGNVADELLRRYPFAQENGYRIAATQGERRPILAVQIESGFISRLSYYFETARR